MNDIQDRLEELKDLGLYRRMRPVSGPQGATVLLDGKPVLVLCSNNYLGFANHPRLRRAAADAAMRCGTGAGASRLVSGNMTVHRRLEEALGEFFGYQKSLLFGSGYHANIGVISTLAGKGDVIFSDELNHASIIDGCRLSGAETFVYRHRDMEHLDWGLEQAEGRGSLIVTDGIFSMDGDLAPIDEIVEIAEGYDARVMVDEAHAVGTFGPGGRGLVTELGLIERVDVLVGTLGKALGSYGAFVCCDRDIYRYLVNTSRPLIFSTAPPPPSIAAAHEALKLLQEKPERVVRLQQNAVTLRQELASEGFDFGESESHILPLLVGEASKTMGLCEAALERGVFAQGIRPPTVPEGSCRLRMTVSASMTKRELIQAARSLGAAAEEVGLFKPAIVRSIEDHVEEAQELREAA